MAGVVPQLVGQVVAEVIPQVGEWMGEVVAEAILRVGEWMGQVVILQWMVILQVGGWMGQVVAQVCTLILWVGVLAANCLRWWELLVVAKESLDQEREWLPYQQQQQHLCGCVTRHLSAETLAL